MKLQSGCATAFLLAFSLFSGADPVLGQAITVPDASDRIAETSSAIVRGLDRVAGTSIDLVLSAGTASSIGHLSVILGECRYPVENPNGEAFAWIEVTDTRSGERLFSGWMIASSPALNALDHRRYDLWVLRCRTS